MHCHGSIHTSSGTQVSWSSFDALQLAQCIIPRVVHLPILHLNKYKPGWQYLCLVDDFDLRLTLRHGFAPPDTVCRLKKTATSEATAGP